MLLIIYLSISRKVFTFSFQHSSDFLFTARVYIRRGTLSLVDFTFDEWPAVDSSGLIFINAPLFRPRLIIFYAHELHNCALFGYATERVFALSRELEQREVAWTMANNGVLQKLACRLNFWVNASPWKFMQRRWNVELTNYYSIREIGLPLPFTESTIFAVDCLSSIIGT